MAAQTAPRKKLIEVSIPLEAINKESAREKAPRAGHPSTMHLWWARRPLAACRAVLFAQLVDDPSACPEEFLTKADQDAERGRLHKIIEAIVPWEASNNETILNEARYEIARSVARGRGDKLQPIGQMKPRQIIDYLQENAPPVYDPFSGGGSIPLEAQRLGLKAVGSDLNPVAVLIGKALVEFPPKFAGRKPVNPEVNELHQWKGAQALASDVRYYGHWMRTQAEKKIGHLYPKVKLKDGKEATVIAWLWARTVPSPDPRARGTQVPLVSSFVVCAKAGKEVIVKPVVDRTEMQWRFDIKERLGKADIETAKKGTKAARGANFVCLLTGTAIDDTHVKSEAMAGRMGAALMAIIAEGQRGRIYLSPTPYHVKAAAVSAPEVPEIDQPLPNDPRNFWTVSYGLDTFAKLFTPRQLMALMTFSDLVMAAREKVLGDAKKHWSGAHHDDTRRLADSGLGPVAYADAVATYLALCVSRQANRSATLTFWDPGGEKVQQVFARQALPMVWDFCECNVFSTSSGNFVGQTEYLVKVIENLPATCSGWIENRNAALNSFDRELIFATDPPYYDNIGYADLSDFFYVWLRRSLASDAGKVWPDLFRRVVTPKAEELVANPYRHNGTDAAEAFFMDGIKKALRRMGDATANFPITLFYAFKQAEKGEDGITSAGWSTFLQGVHDCGLVIDGTWPMRTELAGNLKKKVNALASSIMLVCRRRDTSSPTITRADFLRALRREMPAALAEIRHAGVGPTDIQQAAIGPGIGIFTRHAQVLNTDGTPMLVKDALKLINQVREEITAPATGEYDPETLFALDWFAAKGFEKGRSGDAIVMTNAVNVSLDGMNAAGFFLADGGVARLLKRKELPEDWDPAEDDRATVWEACQHLIKRLRAEDGGIDAAAALYNRLGSRADPAHALARRLYDICEQNQWAAEGYVYNQLHQEWDTIEKRAAALAEAGHARDLFSR
jgi:putative DNA methylase